MPNLTLVRKRDPSSFRMIALGTWRTAKDPSVYGSLQIPMDETLRYIQAFREQTGKRLTVTHLMARVMGAVLEETPDANAILRLHRIYVRTDISVFFQVVMTDPETGQVDLSGVTIREPQQKTLLTIVDEFERAANRVRRGQDAEKEQTRQTFKQLPGWIVGPILDLISLLSYGLNLDLSRFGVPKDVFGSCMVTNVGSLGLHTAYAPLVPYSRVPLLLAMGAVEKVPVVVSDDDGVDRVTVQQRMGLHATFDHRILDGAHAAKMSKVISEWFGDPWSHFDPIERPTP